MIGLGSNRLSVCRRGGMSVTQAGRGGMEWLAGGRMPSWASPYSAQATAALKDAFTAAQWPTIRDYGFAHPALVPFINEDPMLVCSLIPELGRIRFYRVKSGETAQANYAIPTFGYNDTFIVKIRYKKWTSSQWPGLINMNAGGGVIYLQFACEASNGSVVYRIWNGSTYSDMRPFSVTENTLYTFTFNKNSVVVNGTTKYQHSSTYQFNPSTFPIMSQFFGQMGYEFYYAEHWRNGELIHKYVPQGDNAILDIVEAVAYPSTNGYKPYEFVQSPS